MPASNGGTTTPFYALLIPAQITSGTSQQMYTFNMTNFNDANSPSSYTWKVEDVIAGRNPSITRLIVSYTDLGVGTATFTLTGTNDNGQVVSSSQTVTLGNSVPTNKVMSKVIGINLTGENLQLSVLRNANAGPVSITKIRMEGKVELTVY